MSIKQASRAYLVESIPYGLEDLVAGKRVYHTARVFRKLINASKSTIDLTAMYWCLTPNPKRADEKGFSLEQLTNKFGGKEGAAVYKSLQSAAARGVAIRIIESPGFDPAVDESGNLEKQFPEQVQIRKINLSQWYNSGIMHQKIWIFDEKHIYVGSANNDWKAMTQVKELGIAIEHNQSVAKELKQYFETWWAFSSIPNAKTTRVFDPMLGIERTVPSWSQLSSPVQSDNNPINKPRFRSKYDWHKPLKYMANGIAGELFFSGAPSELCVGNREKDLETLLKTIKTATKTVCINVMDLAPVSLYARKEPGSEGKSSTNTKPVTPVWWPALYDAIVYAATTRGLRVRLLVSHWAQSSPYITPYLIALQETANAGKASKYMQPGSLEIRRFVVPGWDSTKVRARKSGTTGAARNFPGHTRVNHAKFIVTDQRANIGTSNMTLDYFEATAGTSCNTNHPALVKQLQAIFDRDWNSRYSKKLESLQ